MTESKQKKIIGVLITLLLVVAAISAKFIGDYASTYKSYKTLQAITSLGKPIHSSIESLQQERLLTSLYLTHKDAEQFKAIHAQATESDKHLKQFAEQLKLTQLLLLSIPESKLEETRKVIGQHRSSLNRKFQNFKENRSFYSYVVGDFLLFLDKMYDFADDPQYAHVVISLIALEFYKEAISIEVMNVSHQIYQENIPAGEIPLIRQIISDQIYVQEKLFSVKDPLVLEEIKTIESSPEKVSLIELQKRFEEENPDLKGSPEASQDYIQKGNAYIKRYADLTSDVFKRLDKMAKEGKETSKAQIIKASILALIAILILISGFIFAQKIEVTEE